MDAELVAAIYEAALVPGQWPIVLERLSDLIGAWAGALVTISQTKQARAMTSPGYKSSYDLLQTMPFDNVRVERFMERRYHGFETDLDLCTQAELDTDPLYCKTLYPFGIGWTIGTGIPVPTGDIIIFDLCRKISSGPFDRAAAMVLDLYRPHLARSSLLAARIGLDKARAAANALDAIGLPGCVLTAGGYILAANERLGRLDHVVFAANGRLALRHPLAQSMLERALVTIGNDAAPATRSLPIPAVGDMPPMVVHVLPLRLSARDVFTSADAVLVITPVAAPTAPFAELLGGLFDLTPAEASVARALAAGESIDAQAENSGRSPETIRSHVKSVMSKTGTSRQVELLQLLVATTTAPIGG